MPLRCAVTKASGQGEQLVLDVCQWNPVTGEIMHTQDECVSMLDDAVKYADLRMMEMNTRLLEAYNLEQYFDPGVWQQICSILDVLAGRQTVDHLVRRWESIKEENEALKQQRESVKYDNLEG